MRKATRQARPAVSAEWVETLTGVLHIQRVKAKTYPGLALHEFDSRCCSGRVTDAHFLSWEHIQTWVRRGLADPNAKVPADVKQLVDVFRGAPYFASVDALRAYLNLSLSR